MIENRTAHTGKGSGAGGILVLLGCVLVWVSVGSTHCFAVQTAEPEWEPIPLAEIASICEDKTLSDIEIVRRLVEHLDRRISMSRLTHKTKLNPNPPYEYVVLIRFMAERLYPTKPKGRPEAIEAVMNSLGTLENESEVRSYLYLALGLAGGSPPEHEILRFLEDPKTAQEITAVTLEAMAQSHVPIRSLPRLLQLCDDPWSYVYSPGVGPPAPQRIYPIRDRVCNCLTQLGVKCEKVAVKDNDVDPVAREVLTTTVITIDRKSLTEKLRNWLLDDDPNVWRAAFDALRGIPGEDIEQMLVELESKKLLSSDKLRYLRH